jgi:hypothetical protein
VNLWDTDRGIAGSCSLNLTDVSALHFLEKSSFKNFKQRGLYILHYRLNSSVIDYSNLKSKIFTFPPNIAKGTWQ